MSHDAPITASATPAAHLRGRTSRAFTGAALIIAIAALAACKPEAKPADGVDAGAAADAAPAPAAAPAPTIASGAAALVGKTVPPYPDGLEETSGICVAGGEGLERVCDFGLAVVGNRTADAEPSARYLLATRNTGTDAKEPQWAVTDAVDTPDIDAGYVLQIVDCRLDGVTAPGLAVVVRHGDAEYSSDVTWARRLDTATGKLGDVPADSVDCADPGAGI